MSKILFRLKQFLLSRLDIFPFERTCDRFLTFTTYPNCIVSRISYHSMQHANNRSTQLIYCIQYALNSSTVMNHKIGLKRFRQILSDYQPDGNCTFGKNPLNSQFQRFERVFNYKITRRVGNNFKEL